MPEAEWNEYIYSKYFKYILMTIAPWESVRKAVLPPKTEPPAALRGRDPPAISRVASESSRVLHKPSRQRTKYRVSKPEGEKPPGLSEITSIRYNTGNSDALKKWGQGRVARLAWEAEIFFCCFILTWVVKTRIFFVVFVTLNHFPLYWIN